MSDKSEIEAIRAVKRYTQPCVQQQLGPEFKVAEVPLFESAKGKYVLFTDYDALLAERDALRRRVVQQLSICVRSKDRTIATYTISCLHGPNGSQLARRCLMKGCPMSDRFKEIMDERTELHELRSRMGSREQLADIDFVLSSPQPASG